jgi:hypothetical protein
LLLGYPRLALSGGFYDFDRFYPIAVYNVILFPFSNCPWLGIFGNGIASISDPIAYTDMKEAPRDISLPSGTIALGIGFTVLPAIKTVPARVLRIGSRAVIAHLAPP